MDLFTAEALNLSYAALITTLIQPTLPPRMRQGRMSRAAEGVERFQCMKASVTGTAMLSAANIDPGKPLL